MIDEHLEPSEGHPHVDADAVCEQCATVNPPGTLLCKTCGNNLRDQLLRRGAGEIPLDVIAEPSVHPRRILTGLLGIFGLLLILWTALNVSNIEMWLTEGFTESGTSAVIDYWARPQSKIYEELLEKLENNPIRPEEIQEALSAPVSGDTMDGRYILKDSSSATARTLGGAYCVQEGGVIYFVARLRRGRAEVRGRAALKSGSLLEATVIGVQTDEAYLEGKGIAERNEDGSFSCYGISMDSNERFQVVAYRIP